jgi:hypothetical protein
MKQSIRAFAVGLFAAGIIMLVITYFDGNKVESISEMPMDDVVSQLKDKGYRVVSESEYISLSMNKDANKEKTDQTADSKGETSENPDENATAASEKEDTSATASKTEDTSKNEDNQEKAKSFTLKIEAGMPSSSIAKELAANGIVDNADKFIDFLEKEGYAVRIQLGEFKVSSDMSYEQIAKALTK